MSGDVKTRIAARAARELRPGEIVNLGIGIPNLIPGFLGADTRVFLHTENGLLGVGPRPGEDELDPDLIDAAKQPVTALPGAAYFDSAASFAMIRGGHVDVAVLGALAGQRARRHRELGHARQGRARRRRRDGPRRRRAPGDRHDDRDVVAAASRRSSPSAPTRSRRAAPPTSSSPSSRSSASATASSSSPSCSTARPSTTSRAVTTAPFVVDLEERHVSLTTVPSPRWSTPTAPAPTRRYDYPDYVGTRLRAPEGAARDHPATLSRADRARRTATPRSASSTHDLTRQHAGEPLGERIVVTGRVLGSRRQAAARAARRDLAGERRRPLPPRGRHPRCAARPELHGGGRCLTDDDGCVPLHHDQARRLPVEEPPERLAPEAHPLLALRARVHRSGSSPRCTSPATRCSRSTRSSTRSATSARGAADLRRSTSS